MRIFAFVILMLNTLNIVAQNDTQVTVIDYQLFFSETIIIEDISLTFEALSEDSRCPKTVACVRAGEAKVILRISDINFEEDIKLTFTPTTVTWEPSEILNKKYINITNLKLLPYPEANKNETSSNYFIEFQRIITNN